LYANSDKIVHNIVYMSKSSGKMGKFEPIFDVRTGYVFVKFVKPVKLFKKSQIKNI